MELIVSTQSIKSGDKEIVLPKSSMEMINKNLKKLEAEIATLKKETISLDDLELT
ncbi:hypothetical protein [Sphingobacterium sp.]|uniref:hypothetical protein n=1 Tax=Sphingobacterium sp. TaxID=341027 RepID=UPI0028998FD8|nr:hypothetical protein [Sphingobacterium sp.]